MNNEQLYQLNLIVPEKTIECFEQGLDGYASAVTMSLIEEGSQKGKWNISAIFEAYPDKQALAMAIAVASMAMGIEEPEWDIVPIENKNWLKESLANFPPLELGRYYIYGSHIADVVVPKNKIGLKIDAATAFGSGKHATTQGCLQAFDDALEMVKISNILDMGCGSGILSMAAAKVLKNVHIDAVDIDPEAVSMTQKNIIENNVKKNINAFCSDGYEKIKDEYDLIFANILARPLIDMSGDLFKHLKKGGIAILSGFLNHQKSWVLKSHEKQGLSFVKDYKIKEWSTIIVKRT